jgi:hypothetical protein
MILIRTCWYLCVLFIVALGCTSAITVVPGGETEIGIIMLVLLALCITSGATALILSHKFKSKPNFFIFKSKLVTRVSIGIAVVMTILILFGVIG